MNNYQHNRKKHYVDHKIQGWMITAMIALEVLLIIGALFYLYLRFEAIFEANIYQVHKMDSDQLMKALLVEMGIAVAAMSAINIAALFIAYTLWISYVKRVLINFRTGLHSLAQLDFRPREVDIHAHRILHLQAQWTNGERELNTKLRELIKRIATLQKPGNHEEREKLRQSAILTRKLLIHLNPQK